MQIPRTTIMVTTR